MLSRRHRIEIQEQITLNVSTTNGVDGEGLRPLSHFFMLKGE